MVTTQQTEDIRAIRIINMAEQEKTKAQNFRNLYQQVANLMYPVENQITTKKTPGEDKSLDVRDPTAMIALDKATSGFIAAWIPRDRQFFGIRVKDETVAELDVVKRWVALAVQIAHQELFDSNYLQQLQQTIKACLAFGIGSLYSEFSLKRMGLNFKDRHVSTYTIKEDADGHVNTHILELEMTARQAAEEFENPSDEIKKDADELKKESNKYKFIEVIRERPFRGVRLITSVNMPWEAIVVDVKAKKVVDEGGYEEFCYAVPRWEKSSVEKYGRGRGTMGLSAVKELQQMRRDFLECGNRWNNPPLETVDNNIEGEVDSSPGARNHVTEKNSINILGGNGNAMGNFPITREILDMQRDLIKNEIFYNDIFTQFMNLRGDRRNELELQLRGGEGLDQLATPVINLESELFTPNLTRCVLLLIRNGVIPKPPRELQGKRFGLEYMGKLAMAMKQYQAKAFMQFAQILPNLEASFPGAKDIISIDRALPDIALAFGMKTQHLSTQEEIQATRQQRANDLMAQRAMQAAQVASKGYKETSKAAEEDSPAQQIQESISGG